MGDLMWGERFVDSMMAPAPVLVDLDEAELRLRQHKRQTWLIRTAKAMLAELRITREIAKATREIHRLLCGGHLEAAAYLAKECVAAYDRHDPPAGGDQAEEGGS